MSGGNGRQFVKYNFYKVDPEWRRRPDEQRADNRGEFAALVDEFAQSNVFRSPPPRPPGAGVQSRANSSR